MSTGEAGGRWSQACSESGSPANAVAGGVNRYMSSVFRYKSTEGQIDDESPRVAVDVDLLPRTSTLLPLKYGDCTLRAIPRQRALQDL